MLRVPLLLCGSALLLLGGYYWFAGDGPASRLLLIGLVMVAVGQVYKWLILDV